MLTSIFSKTLPEKASSTSGSSSKLKSNHVNRDEKFFKLLSHTEQNQVLEFERRLLELSSKTSEYQPNEIPSIVKLSPQQCNSISSNSKSSLIGQVNTRQTASIPRLPVSSSSSSSMTNIENNEKRDRLVVVRNATVKNYNDDAITPRDLNKQKESSCTPSSRKRVSFCDSENILEESKAASAVKKVALPKPPPTTVTTAQKPPLGMVKSQTMNVLVAAQNRIEPSYMKSGIGATSHAELKIPNLNARFEQMMKIQQQQQQQQYIQQHTLIQQKLTVAQTASNQGSTMRTSSKKQQNVSQNINNSISSKKESQLRIQELLEKRESSEDSQFLISLLANHMHQCESCFRSISESLLS